MIKHIVMWNVRSNDDEDRSRNIEKIKTLFDALKPKIPGLLKLEIGVDNSRIDYACDVVLYSEFESQEALDAYVVNPDHQSVKDKLIGLRTSRHQVDYLID